MAPASFVLPYPSILSKVRMLVDSHCHLDRLDLTKYADGLTGAINAARAQGVAELLCVCISEENRDKVVAIAKAFDGVYASVGVHPSEVGDSVVSVAALGEWAAMDRVIALGETGLDYHYSQDTAEAQKRSFANHLVAGAELKLPVIIHTRAAKADTLDLMAAHGCRETAGVMHCFTEDWEMARASLDLGFYISISGIVTFRNAAELRDVVLKIPADRLLVETDSPYLAPVPFRGKPNEPQYVRQVAEYIAELRGVAFEELAEQTTANFARLFKTKQRWAAPV